MPRQATRLVLGRSAEAKLTLPTRPFSTGPRLRAEDDGNRKPPSTRAERSAAAASALDNLRASPSQNNATTFRKYISPEYNSFARTRPAGIGSSQNVISLKSLPVRVNEPPPEFKKILANGKPLVSAPGLRSRAGVLSYAYGPRLAGPRPGGTGRFVGRPGGRPGGPSRGQRAGGARGGRTGGVRGRKRDDANKKKNEGANTPISWNDTAKDYMRDLDMGVDSVYKPSLSPSTLVGWGPAVATNTSTGLHEIAVRNIRLMAGGRPHSEGEQTFIRTDTARWMQKDLPLYFSSMEQKEGVVKSLNPTRKGLKPIFTNQAFRNMLNRLKKRHGDNYGAFVKAFNQKFDIQSWRQKEEVDEQLRIQKAMTMHSGTVKEAITKYTLKGEHPPVQYTDGSAYSTVASYHARSSTYRPADAAKFEAKMKTLVAP